MKVLLINGSPNKEGCTYTALKEVEGALRLDSRVKDVFVRGYSDEKLGVQIELNITGDFSGVNEVKELCRCSLPAYQIPTRINLMDEIPKNGSGKIIRR